MSNDSAIERGSGNEFEFAFALRQREEVMSKLPNGLVVSSDDEVRPSLAEILGQCGLAPLLSSTVAQSRIALGRHEVFIVLCNDCLADGTYEDILKLVGRFDTEIPVIVVSKTGDWPEYFRAVRGGAFDYLPYPPIPQDLQQIIRTALLGHKRQRHLEGA